MKLRRTTQQERMKSQSEVPSLRKLAVLLMVSYLVLTVLFYFLAGEQLHLRTSRSNQQMPAAEHGTVELYAGNVVEQYFTTEIQRLEKISVQWGTYYRTDVGTLIMELYDLQNNRLLMARSFDASAVPEGGTTELAADEPLEGLYQVPLLLKVYSPDGQPGSSLSPMMNDQATEAEFSLALNGEVTPGMLCFALSGTDYIWTGLHYWLFVAIGFVILLLFIGTVWNRQRKGKRSYVINAVVAVQKYRFLIRQLVSRDFKTKYKRSILGVFWSFLNPLLTMCVQYFVFSTIFKNDVENFAVYLLIGVVMFNFFSEASGMALTSILGNASLITKVYVPKYIYPLTRVLSSMVNLVISLAPLIIMCLATGVHFQKSAVLALYFLVCLVVFCLGLGLLLSTSMVFFRDTQFLWGVLSMMWMYATPIFYPESILPEQFRLVLQINPLYHFLTNVRLCILGGISPEPVVYIQCLLIALGMLMVGAFIFYKNQDKFVLYL